MTDLERLAAAVLSQWRLDGRSPTDAIGLGAILDHTLPYRVARRLLGIDASEDYEALVLRLVAEEDGLVSVDPAEAAEMARATLASRLPDLDVLHLLRTAQLTFAPDAAERLADVHPLPRPEGITSTVDEVAADEDDDAGDDAGPEMPAVRETRSAPPRDVIPLPVGRFAADATAVTPPAAPPSPPPAFLTGVAFEAPAAGCWRCQTALPGGRVIKFCPECGADQREPVCAGCGATVERGWKHCAECGRKQP